MERIEGWRWSPTNAEEIETWKVRAEIQVMIMHGHSFSRVLAL